MAGNAGELVAHVKADVKEFTAGMDKAVGKLDEVNGATKKTGQHFIAFAKVMAGAFAAKQIIDFGVQLFDLGAKAEAFDNRFQTVFRGATTTLSQWAEDSAQSFGVTDSALRGMLASVGDLLVPMGFGRDTAGEMSQEVLNLAIALSDFTGGQRSVEETTSILTKALLGQRESLVQLGVSLSDADVKARLAEQGLAGLTGEALDQAEAQIALEEITRQSADALTAFADGGNKGLAAQREMSAAIDEVRESLGEMVVKLAPAIKGLADLVGVVGDAVGALSGAENPTMVISDAWRTALTGSAEDAENAVKFLKEAIGLISMTMGVDAAGATMNLIGNLEALRGTFPQVAAAVQESTYTVVQSFGAWLDSSGNASAMADRLAAAAGTVGSSFVSLGGHVDTLNGKLGALDDIKLHDKSFSVTMNTLPGISMTQFNPLYAAEQELLASSLASIGYTGMQRAAGGPVGVGQSAIVGEAGPELLTVGEDGAMVTPFSKLKKLAGGGKVEVGTGSSTGKLGFDPASAGKLGFDPASAGKLGAPSWQQSAFQRMGWMWTNWAGQQKQTVSALEGLEDKMEAATATAAAGIAAPHMTDSGNTTNINVYVTVEGSIRSDRELAKVVESELVRAIRRGGASDVLS